MNKWLLAAAILAAPSMAMAEDTAFFGTQAAADVMNGPGVAVELGKSAVNVAEPAIEHIYDFGGEWRTGTSMAIWTYQDIATVRAGYAVDYLPYISAPVHWNSVLKRFDATKSVGEKLDIFDKYTTIGPWAGYNYDRLEDGNSNDGGLVYGVSLGAKLTF
jgi:hypothetical protein